MSSRGRSSVFVARRRRRSARRSAWTSSTLTSGRRWAGCSRRRGTMTDPLQVLASAAAAAFETEAVSNSFAYATCGELDEAIELLARHNGGDESGDERLYRLVARLRRRA